MKACDLKGDCFVFDTEVFEAVVIQHEIDHLDGKLFIEFKRKAYR